MIKWSLFKLSTQRSILKIAGIRTRTLAYGDSITEEFKPVRKCPEKRKAYYKSSFFLLVPIGLFGLGIMAFLRKRKRDNLIDTILIRTHIPAIDFPEDYTDLQKMHMEYRLVHFVGKFDHSKEIQVGPRSLFSDFGAYSSGETGYQIITPFNVAGRNITILVNRGWVPENKRLPRTRKRGQTKKQVEITGFIRFDEKHSLFVPENIPEKGIWYYKDIKAMSHRLGTLPIYIEANASSSVPYGPTPGQTRIALEPEDMTPTLIVLTLTVGTFYMWFTKFVHPKN